MPERPRPARRLPPQFPGDSDGETQYWLCKIFVIDGQASGLGILETATPVTDDDSHFVPHCIVDGERTFSPTDVPVVLIQDAISVTSVQDAPTSPTAIPNYTGFRAPQDKERRP